MAFSKASTAHVWFGNSWKFASGAKNMEAIQKFDPQFNALFKKHGAVNAGLWQDQTASLDAPRAHLLQFDSLAAYAKWQANVEACDEIKALNAQMGEHFAAVGVAPPQHMGSNMFFNHLSGTAPPADSNYHQNSWWSVPPERAEGFMEFAKNCCDFAKKHGANDFWASTAFGLQESPRKTVWMGGGFNSEVHWAQWNESLQADPEWHKFLAAVGEGTSHLSDAERVHNVRNNAGKKISQ